MQGPVPLTGIPVDVQVHPVQLDTGQLRKFRGGHSAAFRRILNLGMTDAFRARSDAPEQYSFWDYQAGAWQRDHGFRIDHLLLSPELADRMTAAGVDKEYRGREKASDHTPVWVEFAD